MKRFVLFAVALVAGPFMAGTAKACGVVQFVNTAVAVQQVAFVAQPVAIVTPTVTTQVVATPVVNQVVATPVFATPVVVPVFATQVVEVVRVHDHGFGRGGFRGGRPSVGPRGPLAAASVKVGPLAASVRIGGGRRR